MLLLFNVPVIVQAVERAVKKSGIPREEIWITSKLWPTEYGEGKTLKAIDEMLERMQVDYIDRLYVHQPVGDFAGAWPISFMLMPLSWSAIDRIFCIIARA